MSAELPEVGRLAAEIRTRLAAQSLKSPDESAMQALAVHFHELYRWNRRVNLTSVRDWRQGLDKHLVESWSGAYFLRGQKLGPGPVADLGSGTGYPGIPVLAALADREGLLVEARARKADFLRSVLRRSGLAERVSVLERRLGGASELPGPPALVTLRAMPDPESWIADIRSRLPDARVAAWLSTADAERIAGELTGKGTPPRLHQLPRGAGCVLLTAPAS